MNTPIFDFLNEYKKSGVSRFHMPGHKGKNFIGCEEYDITEIQGADNLYSADGIIKASEDNASRIFGTARTLYSTEGSTQCIKAMIYLASMYKKSCKTPYILASRNAHKAFIYALSLCDIDAVWLYPDKTNSLCSAEITPNAVENYLKNASELPIAVYLTSPDYLGGMLDIKAISAVCKKYDVLLLVDNAHGAYLNFTEQNRHPMSLGADLCCDSAHKTLPVITGGAYLHISKQAPSFFGENAKSAMAIFGSTSPSYLTLCSLDLCNKYLSDGYSENLAEKICEITNAKEKIKNNGWCVLTTEPLKITVQCPENLSGYSLANMLKRENIECEFFDKEYLVMMLSTETKGVQITNLVKALGKNTFGAFTKSELKPVVLNQAMSIRNAVFSQSETVSLNNAVGRICALPTSVCPPAIPIAVSGEIIDDSAVALMRHYGIEKVSVVTEK